jgi:hypothetical protein
MFTALILTLCLSTAPAPKPCTVTNIDNNIVTVEQNQNLYAFKGTNFKVGDKLIAIFSNDQIIEIL